MLHAPRSTDMPSMAGACGGFWSGPIAETTLNGHRLRFFEPSAAAAFPDIAIGDFVDVLDLSDQRRRRATRWMRNTFVEQIRWRWSRPGFVRTVPLWTALSAIDEFTDAGQIDEAEKSAFLAEAAAVVRNRIGDVSEAEGSEIVTSCLRHMTAEIERATARFGRGA